MTYCVICLVFSFKPSCRTKGSIADPESFVRGGVIFLGVGGGGVGWGGEGIFLS